MLDAVHCMPYVVYCLLYGICCTRYALCCMMYAVWCMLYIVYLMLYVGSMLYAVCFTMLFNVSYCNVLRRFWRQIASFQEGEILPFLIFRFTLLKNRYKIFTGNHDRILRKSIKKSVPSGSKLIKNQSKMGSRRVLGPSGGPSRSPGGLGVDFWSIFWSILGSILELKFIKIIEKSIWNDLKSSK